MVLLPLPAGAGGPGDGAGVFHDGSRLRVINCTFAANRVLGGAGQQGSYLSYPGGDSYGGGLSARSAWAGLTNCTFFGNAALGGAGYPSAPNGIGYGGNVASVSNLVTGVENSLVASNSGGGDVFGTISGDPNLIGLDPRLGPLAPNGGPTLTILSCILHTPKLPDYGPFVKRSLLSCWARGSRIGNN